MGQVIIGNKLRLKLDNFVDLLYSKSYFVFKNSAQSYVDAIYFFIETIPQKQIRNCANPKFGKYYVRYDNPKSEMKYYITFDINKERFLVKNIISPKTKEYDLVVGKSIK